jgi:hypothetical protein
VSDRVLLGRLIRHGAFRVPKITEDYWVMKALTVGAGVFGTMARTELTR